ncbi:hypothetical protein [Burkholderia sp. LMG 21824]|uniref:hypothetical protein n=1 Tax=Burkholderia sp. LMG 21824 TaxID=3158172 RepID=UPI003C2B9684
MGMLQNEYRRYESSCVCPELPAALREDVRLTFFAGAVAAVAYVSSGLRDRADTIAGLLKCLAFEIAEEGARGGFDWEFVTDDMPDVIEQPVMGFLPPNFDKLTREQKDDLREMVNRYIAECIGRAAKATN